MVAEVSINNQRVQLLCLPAFKGDDCLHVWMFCQGYVHVCL